MLRGDKRNARREELADEHLPAAGLFPSGPRCPIRSPGTENAPPAPHPTPGRSGDERDPSTGGGTRGAA